jgi:predicted transcriptional regulator
MTPNPEEIPSVQKEGNIVKCHLLSDTNFIAVLASDRNERK